ncbi:hypothetical protein ADL02_30880 [Streptomyces sp. NRRL WC-3723]|nr:hypothetical protein ADL02_30880 [Streptomyces sp. NRRL WC-3723]
MYFSTYGRAGARAHGDEALARHPCVGQGVVHQPGRAGPSSEFPGDLGGGIEDRLGAMIVVVVTPLLPSASTS